MVRWRVIIIIVTILTMNCFSVYVLSVYRLQGSVTRTACSVSSRVRCPRNPERDCRRRPRTARRRTSRRCRLGLLTRPPARCPRVASSCQTVGMTITTSSANITGMTARPVIKYSSRISRHVFFFFFFENEILSP